ncbi:MAG: hypothetical protein ABFS46_21985 [Myxococcota bacterium]
MTGVISRGSFAYSFLNMDEGSAPTDAELHARVRRVPGVRTWRTLLRTAHLISFGALYGGHVYGIPEARLEGALMATVATGGTLMAFEIYRAPIWLVQVRGAATAGKIALLVLAQGIPQLAVPLLTLVIAIGALSSHMPGRWRYHSLRHGRVVGPREKG